MLAVAAALCWLGMGIQVSAAPFPGLGADVYQGAPTPWRRFSPRVPRPPPFAVFVRIFATAFEPIGNRWEPWCGAPRCSPCVSETSPRCYRANIKRMLAYSSIRACRLCAGGAQARSEDGTAAIMFYLAAYAFMKLGASPRELPRRKGERL